MFDVCCAQEWESEADWLKHELAKEGFTAITAVMDAEMYRSPMRRVRWWAVVLDLPPEYCQMEGIEASILEYLNAFRMNGHAAHGFENFFLDG